MSDDTPKVYMWKGKRADTLTREELLTAFEGVCKQLELFRRWREEEREMEDMFRETRRRLGL